MLRNVNICDDCKDEIATEKCSICGGDLCEGCLNGEEFLLKMWDWNNNEKHFNLGKTSIIICQKCFDKEILNPNKSFMKDFLKEIDFENKLKEKIEKELMVDRLAGDKE